MVAACSSSSFVVLLLVLLVACTTVTAFDNLYEENALYAGQRLRDNDKLRWGDNELMMHPECNLCFHHGWCSKTDGKGTDCSAFLLHNGNLVIYARGGSILWQSNTAGAPGDYVLLVQEDKNAVLYGKSIWSTRKSWRPTTATATATATAQAAQQDQRVITMRVGVQPTLDGRCIQNVLYEGEYLLVNEELRSKSYRLIMQEDCNLVLYNAYDTLWTSNTGNVGTHCSAGLGRGGNLVIYNELGYPVWSSGSSSGNGDYILILQNDGVAMIYGKVLWSALPFTPRGLTLNSTPSSSISHNSNISMVTSNE